MLDLKYIHIYTASEDNKATEKAAHLQDQLNQYAIANKQNRQVFKDQQTVITGLRSELGLTRRELNRLQKQYMALGLPQNPSNEQAEQIAQALDDLLSKQPQPATEKSATLAKTCLNCGRIFSTIASKDRHQRLSKSCGNK